MLHYLFKKLEELLLPERQSDDGAQYLEPVDVLRLIHQRVSQLAQQIESHAELAPYPQVAERLRRIASEKRDSGNRLKQIIEKLHGAVTEGSQPSTTGKNHWQRLIRDLEDQKALDDLLSRYEFIVTRQVPELADFLQELKTIHETHRRALTQLTAVADPQATQT
jgi:iron-sulfur cluster repair protein YtfE (RIC family)